MSISNLLSPNNYDIQCDSITVKNQVIIPDGGSIKTESIDATVSGGPVNIGGGVTTGSVNIGHNGIPVLITGGEIIIDASPPAAVPANILYLGNTNSNSVVIGRPGGSITTNCPIVFPGPGEIGFLKGMTPILATCGGCIPATANYILFEGFRLNNTVFLRWRFTGSIILATAASTLSVVEVLDVNFRPPITQIFPCGVIGDSAGVQSVFPGTLHITTIGNMFFSFMGGGHAATTTWAIGERVGTIDGSVSYDIIL